MKTTLACARIAFIAFLGAILVGQPPRFVEADVPLAPNGRLVGVADMNADGRSDLVFWDAIGTYRSLGDGTFVAVPSMPPLPTTSSALTASCLGDFDGDGLPELIASGSVHPRSNAGLWTGRNDGTGRSAWVALNLAPGIPLTAGNAWTIRTLDVDGDGDRDAYVAGARIPTNVAGFGQHDIVDCVLTNNGTAPWSPVLASGPNYFTRWIAAGDLDGDGDEDIVRCPKGTAAFGAPNPVAIEVLRAVPGGSLATPVLLPTMHDSWDAALADFDGDADLDLVLANESPLPGAPDDSVLFWNDGMGAFTTAPMLPAVQARSVETGDLDRDGDIDLLLGGRILFNNGAGVFTLGPVLASVTSGQSEGWAIFDVDADQDLDIVHPGGDIFLANGTGGFSPAIPGWPSTTILVGNTPLEARGDFDGDADVDFVSPTGHRLINTTLHLEATSLAHTGRIARFGLAGAASASWFLALAAQPASILASPYGTLRLDPATLTFVGSGSLGTAGEVTVQLAVPNVATLAGTTVHLQAVVGTAFGPRLTRRIAPIIVD